MNDSELIARIGVRDKAAMEVFFHRHRSAVLAFLRGRGAEGEEADDALQEAMLDVWRLAAGFKGDAAPRTWLLTIARNKMVDQRRKSSRVSYVEEVPESGESEPDAEMIMASAQDKARVRACLGKLSPRHLSVIRLAFFEHLTYAEVSTVEGLSEGTVKSRIFHAKKLLLRCLSLR